VGATAALLALERLVLVVSERSFLRPVLAALMAGAKADAPEAVAAKLPTWASAGALLRARDSASQELGRQLADGTAADDEAEVSATGSSSDVAHSATGHPSFL